MLYASLLGHRTIVSLFHKAVKVIGILDLLPEHLLEGDGRPHFRTPA